MTTSNIAVSASESRGDQMVLWWCLIAVSFQLLRLSIEFIQTASQKTSVDYKEDHHGSHSETSSSRTSSIGTAGKISGGKVSGGPTKSNYGSTMTGEEQEIEQLQEEEEEEEEYQPFVPRASSLVSDEQQSSACSHLFIDLIKKFVGWLLLRTIPSDTVASTLSVRIQSVLWMVVLAVALHESGAGGVIPSVMVWTCITLAALNIVLTSHDLHRQRFGYISRVLYVAAFLTILLPLIVLYYGNRLETSTQDEIVVNTMSLLTLLSIGESLFVGMPVDTSSTTDKKTARLSRSAIMILLKPYFWPDATDQTAMMNRVRAILTWVSVILSKTCNLVSPILLGWASTALAHQQYTKCIYLSISYSMIQFFGAVFKEGQSLIYLKVAQAAFVQLSETTFVHLHQLSFDWHIRKKLGETIRSMDRGIAACDTLMKYLFLWLVPALAECFVVCIIFATYFQYTPLAITVFYFVWIYIVWTILLTLWRKKFRKAVVKSDNEWHDRATDSLINYDTVKFFNAEEYERQRFGDSVKRYQAGSVAVQASLSFLNISQRLILQLCLAVALSLSALGIKQRIDCCITDAGCSEGVSDCCRSIPTSVCPGMEVGDFVAVLTYTLQLFQPLNFLGSVYNAIVMAIIDLTNLSELLAQNPDVKDAADAIPLPETNESSPDVAVEFDNVFFHYPTQNSSQGLKGVSFKMKRGTTTAIVGPTGAGKTTISRLFFRFYDVLSGAVKVNGVDVRSVTQKSLRGAVGVVPQAASMFNDTIRANLRYGRRDATQAELEQAANDAQILDFINSLDAGWDTMVGDRGLKLSGGEKQRAAIARCLLKDPPFVLLDEATSALDTITEKSVQEALDRLGSHRTVLVIAHRLGTIRNADNIVVLKDGVVAEQGTHDELVEKPDGIYAGMWNMQLHSTSNAGSQVSLVGSAEG